MYVVDGRPYASFHDILRTVVGMDLREKCDYVESTAYRGHILVSEDHYQITDMGMSIKAVTYVTVVFRCVPGFDNWYRREVADLLANPEPDVPELDILELDEMRREQRREYISTLPLAENHLRVDNRRSY